MDAAARVQTWIDERLNIGELLAPTQQTRRCGAQEAGK
jgi:hypothetical protein